MTIRRLQPHGRLSGAAIHGDTVYLAGQVADDPTLDTEGQTTDVLRQIDALLAEAGTDKSRVLFCQVFLADIADIAAMKAPGTRGRMERIRRSRATVEAKLNDPRWRVEITAVAAMA